MNNIATLILEYIESDDRESTLKLRLSYLALNWTIGKIGRAKVTFQRASRQLNMLDSINQINGLSFQGYQKEILDYGCGFDLNFLSEYRNFAENYEGEKGEVLDMNAVAKQCSACRLLRAGKLDEAKQWIERMEDEIEANYKNSTLFLPKKSYRLFYFHFVKGAYLFKINSFDKAELELKKAHKYFEEAGLSPDLVERAFIYYMFYKIYKEETNFKAQPYGFLALEIMRRSIHKNYCLFDYNKILSDLIREFSNLEIGLFEIS